MIDRLLPTLLILGAGLALGICAVAIALLAGQLQRHRASAEPRER